MNEVESVGNSWKPCDNRSGNSLRNQALGAGLRPQRALLLVAPSGFSDSFRVRGRRPVYSAKSCRFRDFKKLSLHGKELPD
ncbi:unnamed protein product [Dovyalis caffra]|uniref:Uncharacterized protein n=1 Tax=Dovyalis caffra TaxID=77055 RepID=A0AAV1RDX4_9ROSI|nr:unnamed protein product [Dovyalis caffra]